MTDVLNPYYPALICFSLQVSFGYPSGVQIKLQRDSRVCNGSLNGCLLPFRYPSSILLVSFRCPGKMNISEVNSVQSGPGLQINKMVWNGILTSGPSLRACLRSPLINRSVDGSVNGPVNGSVNRSLNGWLLPFWYPSGVQVKMHVHDLTCAKTMIWRRGFFTDSHEQMHVVVMAANRLDNNSKGLR